jgi:phospholipid-translocating ATPase
MRFSKLYTWAGCFKPPTQLERQQSMAAVGGPGFSRVVFCNDSEKHLTKPYRYKSNYVSTTKYNALTFFPKALFEQFRRVANLYFLLAAALALTPVSPYSASSLIAPLVFVVGVSMCKEALEDWRRFLQVSGSHLLTLKFPPRHVAPPPLGRTYPFLMYRKCAVLHLSRAFTFVPHMPNLIIEQRA